GIVAQPIDYRIVSSIKTTDGSQLLTECTHNHVYIFGNSEKLAHTTAVFSVYSQTVSILLVNARIVYLLQSHTFGQIGQVTFHGKYSIHNNQLYSIRFAFLEFFFQSLHIVMLVLQLSGKCKTAAIYNGSVVTVITNNIIPTAYNGRNNTFVYSKSGRKTECFIFSYEFSQFLLQFNMYIECSVQKAGTCTTGAI